MKKAYRTTKFGIVSSRLYRDERDPAFELPEVTEADAGKVATVSDAGTWEAAAPVNPLPSVTDSDEGKVLTVSSQGKWTKAAVPTELPAVTSADAGKVLTVGDNGAWGAATAPDPLPEVTSADAGKVLTVSNAGAWEAAAASGGGSIPVLTITGLTSLTASGYYIGFKESGADAALTAAQLKNIFESNPVVFGCVADQGAIVRLLFIKSTNMLYFMYGVPLVAAGSSYDQIIIFAGGRIQLSLITDDQTSWILTENTHYKRFMLTQ